MRHRGLVLVLLLVTAALAGCANSGPGPSATNPIEPCGTLDQSFTPQPEHNPRIRMETSNGTMTILVYGRQVPFTAGHVGQLVERGVWDDTRFHFLFPDEAIFGGDPRSTNDTNRNAWGTGGYKFNVVDEHHQFLRHDEPGIVSLLSPQPNGGGSQFVILLSPQPRLDDRNPVFGKVIEGMDTAHGLAETPTDNRGRPLFGAHLENLTWVDPPDPEPEPPELTAYGFDCVEIAEPGGTAEHLVAVRNTGQSILNGTLASSLDDEEGWSAELTNADQVVVSSGQTVVYGVNVTVPADAEIGQDRSVELRFTGEGDAATSLELTTRVAELGQPAVERDEVELRYVGVLEDGRVFDTTESLYTDAEALTWFKEKPAEPEPVTLEPSPETLNRSQPGQLVERARLGETVVGFVPPGEAYGSESYGENDLGGRLLVFQVHITASS